MLRIRRLQMTCALLCALVLVLSVPFAQSQAIALGGNISYLTQADLAPPTPNQQPSALPGSQGYYPRSWPIWKAKAMGEKR